MTSVGMAQGVDDALRFSQSAQTGTARSMAMGNAFGALGGDLSAVNINPAGVAVYRASEFTVTPSLIFNKSKSEYYNINREGDGATFVPNQIGATWSMMPLREVETGLVSSHFSIGYNRTANFNYSGYIKGEGIGHSLLDQIVFNANGLQPNQLNDFNTGIAYDLYLLENPEFTIGGDNVTFNDIYFNAWQKPSFSGDINNPNIGIDWRASRGINQQRFVEQDGYTGEFNFAVGANISNKLYLGGSLNAVAYQFKEKTMHSESPNGGLDDSGDPNWDAFDMASFNYRTYLDQRASGFNMKLGVIYKPIHQLRIGLAYHTPTYYRVEEEYQSKVNVEYVQSGNHLKDRPLSGVSPLGEDEYRFRTADKLVGSIGVVLGNMVVLSFDYEHSNHASAKYKPLTEQYRDYSAENGAIRSVLTATNVYRVGIEYKPISLVALRAGYANYGSPIKSSMTVNKQSFETFSGGVGFRKGEYFVDAAYMMGRQTKDYYLYSWDKKDTGIDSPSPAKITNLDHQVAITVGYRF